MKKFIISSLLFSSLLLANSQENYLVVGSYTPAGSSEGIHVYKFNNKTGESTLISSTVTSNASFLAISPDEKYVYAVNEDANDKGSIAAFSFDKKTGTLSFINKKPSGDHPCYVTISNNGKWVITGNYTGGSLAVLGVKNNGNLDEPATIIQHKGSGKDPQRQDKPHVHCTYLSPDNKKLYVPDLGIDKVMVYSFDDKTGKLTPALEPSLQSEPGAGPRHFTFHPNGKYAYLIEELSGTVVAFQNKEGNMKNIQRISSLPPDQKGYAGSADIHVSTDGKFLYASNRGDFNNIAIYKINPNNGELTNIGFQSTLGKAPRNFNFDPSGNFLLVGNQDSDEIVIFDRNKETGLLNDSGKRIKVTKPVCLKWISIK
jgi:6-phosphogluconolactonase